LSYRILFFIFIGILLSGCGFKPLYGNHTIGTASSNFLHIEINSIKDRDGQQLRNELIRRLYGGNQRLAAIYRLKTELNESKSSLAVQKSAFATRGNLVKTANFSLIRTDSGASDFNGASRVTVSYNILSSEFASLLSEKNARERAVRELSEDIRVRLGVYFDRVGRSKG
jgi:LPS-assembly lipoprotein